MLQNEYCLVGAVALAGCELLEEEEDFGRMPMVIVESED